MKAFKGFNRDMTCRGFQYEEGKTYEEPEAKLCDRGFHACADPIDCFNHYGAANSVFHEVELDDLSEEQDKDSKVVAKKITIGAEIDFKDIILGHIEYVNERIAEAVEKGENETLKVGNYQKATVGNFGVAKAGVGGVANTGNFGVANAGFRGVANAGARGVATAGFRGVAVSRGSSETDANGISVARGNRVKAKGRIGTLLVVAEENSNDFGIKSYAVGVVDGTTIKADIWYKCVDGKLVEVAE